MESKRNVSIIFRIDITLGGRGKKMTDQEYSSPSYLWGYVP